VVVVQRQQPTQDWRPSLSKSARSPKKKIEEARKNKKHIETPAVVPKQMEVTEA